MRYREDESAAKQSKIEYLNGLKSVLEKLKTESAKKRCKYFEDIFEDAEQYRNDLKNLLGWPLNSETSFEINIVDKQLLSVDEEYRIYRLKFRVLDNIVLSGLYFKKNENKKPLVFLQNGFLGTPEFMTGFYGDTSNYKDILEVISKYNVDVFSPQLLLWDGEKYGVPFNRTDIDAELKRVGSSITAIEVYIYIKLIDWFENNTDASGFGMIGLSYGGFYTLLVSAIDKRIKSAHACSFFHNMDVFYELSDWTWEKSGEKFSSAEIAALIYPRKLCVVMGDNDAMFSNEVFDSEIERLHSIFRGRDMSWFKSVKFRGIHEFFPDEALIKDFINSIGG